jgi:lysozyme
MKPYAREALQRQLIADEGIRLYAYKDSLGYLTLGCGRLIDRRLGGGITMVEAMYLLDNDIDKCVRQLVGALPWFTALDAVRQTVLCNMCFNLGITRLLKFKNTLAAVERGDYEAAALGMMQSKWATQTGARAERLAKMMKTGAWPNVANA